MRFIAVGERQVTLSLFFPSVRLKRKAERLRDRAVDYVEADLRRFYKHDQRSRQWLEYRHGLRVRTLLAEREAIRNELKGRPYGAGPAFKGIPRWRFYKRRKAEATLCYRFGVAKWW